MIHDTCYIFDSKQKHQEFHTSERTIVPRTVIFFNSVLFPSKWVGATLVQWQHFSQWVSLQPVQSVGDRVFAVGAVGDCVFAT